MSPVYISFFKGKTKCSTCSSPSMPARKMCPLHLKKAKEGYSVWTEKRKTKGLCVRCHRKSHNGFLRCKLHTEINRNQCQAWMARQSPEWRHNKWLMRKAACLAKNECQYCAAKNPPIPGTLRCRPCADRQNLSSRKHAARKRSAANRTT